MSTKKKAAENVFLAFLKEYLRNFREIGSIVPDSRVCVNALLKCVPFDSAELILEYGSASGAVMRGVERRKRRETALICFEKNASFYNLLRGTVDGHNIFLVKDDAFNSADILSSGFGVRGGRVDCIISTLPCSSLDFDELIRKAVAPLLKKDGVFIQYMHTLSYLKGFRLRPILKKYFDYLDADFVLLNTPPALIYTCRTVKQEWRA